MFDFLVRTAPERLAALARRGLTPNDARALASLDGEAGRSMRSLADAWQCDPSYATALIDRLERVGLAERRTVAHDRRVKHAALTAEGARIKRELLEEFHAPPAALLALDRADLEALDRATDKLTSATDEPQRSPTTRPSEPASAAAARRATRPRRR
jgi:DNA-binding MarR family transcriptional regulator